VMANFKWHPYGHCIPRYLIKPYSRWDCEGVSECHEYLNLLNEQSRWAFLCGWASSNQFKAWVEKKG
jgi:hypothetical protein